jgi:hypothetical protein
MARKTEAEIAAAVIVILKDRPNGRATIADLIDEIPNRANSGNRNSRMMVSSSRRQRMLGALSK